MRPCRLRVQGFTSFVEPVEVDFEGLELFAITGPTGAGKTSLLTAMTAALYGRAPEVADDLKQLVSTGGDEARILFEFVAGGRRYRAQRAIHRTRPVQVRLEVQDGAGWKALIRGSRESRGEVERILGLPYETFTKVVLLPQGQVAEFLRGQGRDRRKILTELLGLEIYERVQRAANNAASASQAEVEARERMLRDEYADATAEHLSDVRRQLRQAGERVEQLTQALARVDHALESAREEQSRALALAEARAEEDTARAARGAAETDLVRAQDLLATLAKEIATLDEEIAGLAYDPDRYVALRQAEVESRQLVATRERSAEVAREEGEARRRQDMLAGRLDQQGQALEEARRGLVAAEDGAARARRDLDGLEQQVGRRVEVARLRERAARYAADLGALQSATLVGRAVEDEMGALSARVLTAIQAAERAQHAVTGAEGEHHRRQSDVGVLRVAVGDAHRAVQVLAESRERRTRAERDDTLAAAEASRAAEDVASAHAACQRAQAAENRATAGLQAQRARHVAHALRQDLAPGSPCPVCEQVVNVVPASHAPDLDTAAAVLEDARRVRLAADARFAAAGQGAARAEERAHAARNGLERAAGAIGSAEAALAGCLPPDVRDAADWPAALAAKLAGAERAAQEAAARLDLARREETEATASVREVQARRAALVATLADRRQALDVLTARCAAAAEALARTLSRAEGRDLDVFLADLERALDAAEGAARAADDAAGAARLRAADATRARQQTAEALDREGQATAKLHGEGRRLAREIEALEASLRAALGAADAAALAALPGQVSALDAAREQLDVLASRRAGRAGEMDQARERAAHARASLASAQQRAAAAVSGLAAGQRVWQSARQILDDARAAAGVETAEASPDALARRRTAMAAERDQGLRAQSLLLAQEGTLATRIDRAAALRQALGQSREKAAVARELGQLLGGPQLRDWLLADAMRLLVEDASVHLERLSDGRYRLQAREIEFEVVDRWNADATRSVKTLSGGETFLAALAVALALADRVAGRAEAAHGQRPLESLFIDEGFGALDPDEALDGVALALEQLQTTHRVIGVITHLPHLAERLPAQLRVIKELGRSRVERVES